MPAGHADVSTPFGTTHVPSSRPEQPGYPRSSRAICSAASGFGTARNQASRIARHCVLGHQAHVAHHEHVGVVPRARTGRGGGVGAERGAHAAHLVGGDRRAGARPAEQHAGAHAPDATARPPRAPTSTHCPSVDRDRRRGHAPRGRTRTASVSDVRSSVPNATFIRAASGARRRGSSNGVHATPNAAHHEASGPLANTTSASSAALRSLAPSPISTVVLAAVLRVLDRRLLARRRTTSTGSTGPRGGTAARAVEKSTALVSTSSPSGATRVLDVEAEPVGHHGELGAGGAQRVDQAGRQPGSSGTSAAIARNVASSPSTMLPLVEDALPAADLAVARTARRFAPLAGAGPGQQVHADVGGADGAVEVEEHRRVREIQSRGRSIGAKLAVIRRRAACE